MHKIALSAEVLKMIQEERGTGHSFQSLDLRRTAHVVVDLQNGFMEPGAPVEVLVEGWFIAALVAELVMGRLWNSDIVSSRYCGD